MKWSPISDIYIYAYIHVLPSAVNSKELYFYLVLNCYYFRSLFFNVDKVNMLCSLKNILYIRYDSRVFVQWLFFIVVRKVQFLLMLILFIKNWEKFKYQLWSCETTISAQFTENGITNTWIVIKKLKQFWTDNEHHIIEMEKSLYSQSWINFGKVGGFRQLVALFTDLKY